MAIGLIKLTKRGRYMYAMVFVVLDVIQALLGCATTGWSIYICIAICPSLYSEQSEVTFVFAIIGMYGTHVIFHGLIGVKICYKCYAQAHKKSTRSLLFLWTVGAFNTMLNIFILMVLTLKISKHIAKSMQQSLEKGVKNYLKDRTLKVMIDKMQIKLKCCGVISYTDWYEITWIDKYHINMEHSLVKELRSSENSLHVPVAPWSCCRPDFPMQCFHDPFQQTESAYLWKEQPNIVLDSIYNEGCLNAMRRPLDTAFSAHVAIVFLIFLIQIITVLISRIVYTSCRNAVILDDPDGIAPGWIFGRGDCGWARGPTLGEIMSIASEVTIDKAVFENKSSSMSSGKKLQKEAAKSNTRTNSSRSDDEPISSGDERALMLN